MLCRDCGGNVQMALLLHQNRSCHSDGMTVVCVCLFVQYVTIVEKSIGKLFSSFDLRANRMPFRVVYSNIES